MIGDGFHEWQPVGRAKQPWHFRLRSGEVFAVAGLWESWGKSGPPVETCAIVTTEPNALVAPIHDRMPVIFHTADYARWLGGTPDEARGLIRPYDVGEMVAFPVSAFVSNAWNEGPQCVEPAA